MQNNRTQVADRFTVDRPCGILFDLGGTVLHQERHEPSKGIACLLKQAGIPASTDPDDFQQYALQLYSEIQRRHVTEPIEIRFQSIIRLLCERFGSKGSLPLGDLELEFWKAACSMRPEPGVEETLSLLKTHGIAIGLVSNSVFSGNVLEWELERNGLLRFFHFTMSTADYGLQKPHRAVFETAVAKLGLRLDQVWFVGDNLQKDVAGSAEAGLTAVWYNPAGARCDVDPQPMQVACWTEFAGLVQEVFRQSHTKSEGE
jgi:HAD superfamily hydrolase (TIGR01509 family)